MSNLLPNPPVDPKATRIFLVRHAEVIGGDPKRYNGQRDLDLSPAGITHLEDVASRLSNESLDAIYSSQLMRAYKGAQIIARGRDISVVRRNSLAEKSFGAWEGLTHAESKERFPEEWSQWMADPGSARPPGGETYGEVRDRVLKELDQILNRHRGQQVAIVAHGGVNRTILCHAFRLDLQYIFRIEQRFAALNIIDFFEDGMASVHLMNA